VVENRNAVDSASENPEASQSFDIRVADNLADFTEVWPRTDRCESAHCYVFQCADFLQVWCDTIGRARRTRALFVGVFDDIKRPMLLIPLGIETQCGIRILGFLDGGVCDYNAPVVVEPIRSWRRESLERLWRELIRVMPRFDVAMFHKMPADIYGVPNPLVDLRGELFPESGHVTNITSSWDQYTASQLPDQRRAGQLPSLISASEMRLKRRKLAKAGRVVSVIAETPANRQRIVQVMMRQKSRRCIETGQADELNLPGYRQYYVAMTERFTWPGPLLVAALEVDGKIISTSWGLIFNKRLLWLVTTFEGGEWRRFSPGRMLLEDLLQWSFLNGITAFDFGIGDESYKLAYCDQSLMLYETNIPVTMIGKAYHAAQNTKVWNLLRPLVKHIKCAIRSGLHRTRGIKAWILTN
jgi:CelD/BcsL family acetyltransferase involved in cellulose biosynthesis